MKLVIYLGVPTDVADVLPVSTVVGELLADVGVALRDFGTALLIVLGDFGGTCGGAPSSSCSSDLR